jgi:hypothetical protein
MLDLGASFATAPKVLREPNDRRTLPGSSTRFDVGAIGTVPMTYQWQFNGIILPEGTNSILTLANVQSNQAGLYSVIIRNSAGVTSSSGASLTVDIPSVITLVSPANSEVFLAPASVPLEAMAFDPETNGSVTQVEFYQGGLRSVSLPPGRFVEPFRCRLRAPIPSRHKRPTTKEP